MSVPASCDVLVIGGGPAGSIAAAALAQRDYEVVLLEKERHPRYTVGESLIPHIWKYCDLVGVSPKLEAAGFVVKSGGTAAWRGNIRQFTFRDFGHTRPSLHVERDHFDCILFAHARDLGAQAFERTAVTSVELSEDGPARVHYRAMEEDRSATITSKYVIDASGQHSLIARQLGTRVVDDDFRFMSVWGYFTDSKYVALGGTVHPFAERFVVPPTTFICAVENVDEWGWVWHIPMRETTSVGLVLPQAQMRRFKGTAALEAFFLQQCGTLPGLADLLAAAHYCPGSLHVIRDYSYRSTRLAGPGYYLVGDAGQFVDPIFSVGVPLGMYSAYLAAWSIDRSLRRPATARANAALFARQFADRLEVSRAMALPRYDWRQGVEQAARCSVQFASGLEQELMYVASSLTTRNDNVLDLLERQHLDTTRLRELEAIGF